MLFSEKSKTLSLIAVASLAFSNFGTRRGNAEEAPVPENALSLRNQEFFHLSLDSTNRFVDTGIDNSKASLSTAVRPALTHSVRLGGETIESEKKEAEESLYQKHAHKGLSYLSVLGAALGALLVYKRWLPNILHVNILQPGYPQFLVDKNPENLTLRQTTKLCSSLPGIYHHDILAFVRFYAAMTTGYRHPYWPIANFVNSRMMRFISGGHAAEVVAPELLSSMSSQIEFNAAQDSAEAAGSRLVRNSPTYITSNTHFVCVTFEKADTRQPRAYLIPMANMIDMLTDFKVWWRATQNSKSEDLKQKMCRQIEMAVSLIHRYPDAFRNFFDYNKRVESDPIRKKIDAAMETAGQMLKLLSLGPKESTNFLDNYFNNQASDIVSEHDLVKIYQAFYGVSNPEKQKEFLQLEQGLVDLRRYNELCHHNHLPMWFMLFDSNQIVNK